MTTDTDKLLSDIRALPEQERRRILDALLTDLDIPDPEVDRAWADEARKRWQAYKAGKLESVAYDDLIERFKT